MDPLCSDALISYAVPSPVGLQTLYRKYDTLNWHLLKFLESFRFHPYYLKFYTACIKYPFHRLNLLLKIISHGFVTISLWSCLFKKRHCLNSKSFKFCCAQLNTLRLSVFDSVHRKYQNTENDGRGAKHGAGKPLSNDYTLLLNCGKMEC